MLKNNLFVFLISLILLVNSATAQKASKREWDIFRNGVEQYQNGDYAGAEKNFSLVISKLHKSKLVTANYLMLAKAQYKNGSYNNSLQQCKKFKSQFPNSSYIDDIYYLMANNYYRLNRYGTAVSTWLAAAKTANGTRLSKKALKLAENTIHYRLDERDILNLKKNLKDEFSRRVVQYHLADRYFKAGNSRSALVILDEILDESGSSGVYADKIERLYNILKNKKSNTIRIACLLPLSGANSDIGAALLEGAKIAVDEFNNLNDIEVEVVPYDYETRLITAIDKLKKIAFDHSISAVFGPVENDITAACAAIAEYEDITLITPTASENSLRRLSSSLIQLAAPVDAIAENLIQFTYDSLKIKRVVTLSPIEDYFISLTNAFTQKQKQKGGTVVAEQWYYPGDKNFSKQFRALKRIGLKLAFQDSVLKVDSSLTQYTIDSLYMAYQEEESFRLTQSLTKIDSADMPVTSFDGIFMPVYKEDIGLIAPQIAYANLQAQILGNSDWYDPDGLRKNKNYLNGLIFITDGYLNEESWDYRQFRNNFRKTLKRTPGKFELIGYDSFNFILSAFSKSSIAVGRDGFANALKRAPVYHGIFRSFKVGEKRYNNSTRILKYMYGQIMPLK